MGVRNKKDGEMEFLRKYKNDKGKWYGMLTLTEVELVKNVVSIGH